MAHSPVFSFQTVKTHKKQGLPHKNLPYCADSQQTQHTYQRCKRMSLATVWEVQNVFRKTIHVPLKQSPPLSKQVPLDSTSHCVIQAICVATLDPFLTWHLELLVRHDINILNTLCFKNPLWYFGKPLLSELAASEQGAHQSVIQSSLLTCKHKYRCL